jgi:uncharacterized protein YuzE
MKLRYDADADILILVLDDSPPVDAVEEPDGVILSYGSEGRLLSIELLEASRRGVDRLEGLTVAVMPQQ